LAHGSDLGVKRRTRIEDRGSDRRSRQSHFDSAAPHQGQNRIPRNDDPPSWM